MIKPTDRPTNRPSNRSTDQPDIRPPDLRFFYPPEGYVIFDMCFSCRTAGCLALQGGAPGEEGGPLPARGNHLHQVRNIINLHIRPGFPANKEQREQTRTKSMRMFVRQFTNMKIIIQQKNVIIT